MEFVKYFAVNPSTASKSKDDISDAFPIELVNHIDYNKCFNLRPNKDIYSLNIKKLAKIFEMLSNFEQYDFIKKFKSAYGTDLIKLLNDVMHYKIIIPESSMSNFIIYLILEKYNYSFDSEFIKFFDFIHIERYFAQIRTQLNIISIAEYIILFKYDHWLTFNKFELPMYLLNKGEKLLYNPSCFSNSCLCKALVNNNFDLAYKLINLGCNLYENEKNFKDSALFYAMYFRNRPTNFNGIVEISDKQWAVIKLILSKCKTFNYQIDPVGLVYEDKPLYRVHCFTDRNDRHYNISPLEFEQDILSSGNPFTYALSGYSRDKLDFILRTHPEFFRNVKSESRVYEILTEDYVRML